MDHGDGHAAIINALPKCLCDVPRSAGSITSPRRSTIPSSDYHNHQLDESERIYERIGPDPTIKQRSFCCRSSSQSNERILDGPPT